MSTYVSDVAMCLPRTETLLGPQHCSAHGASASSLPLAAAQHILICHANACLALDVLSAVPGDSLERPIRRPVFNATGEQGVKLMVLSIAHNEMTCHCSSCLTGAKQHIIIIIKRFLSQGCQVRSTQVNSLQAAHMRARDTLTAEERLIHSL